MLCFFGRVALATTMSKDRWWYDTVVDAACDDIYDVIRNELQIVTTNVERWKEETMTHQRFLEAVEQGLYHPLAAATFASGTHVGSYIQQVAFTSTRSPRMLWF